MKDSIFYEACTGGRVIEVEARGMWGYKHGLDLICDGGTIGRLMWGGEAMAGTAAFDVSGTGCDLLDLDVMASLIEFVQARLTRVDLAADFLNGEVSVVDAVDEYYAGGFTGSRGVTPGSRLIDDMGTNTGCTLYIGSRESGKFARIYEKGKKYGDVASPWVRVEVEFKRRDYELTADMLRRPAEFLSGAYPIVAEWIGSASSKLDALKKVVTAEIGHAIHHVQIQCGGVIAYAARRLGWSSDRILRELTALMPSKKLERHGSNARFAEQWLDPSRALPVQLEDFTSEGFLCAA